MTKEEFSSEELAKLTEAGFVKNEQGDWVLPMLATNTPRTSGLSLCETFAYFAPFRGEPICRVATGKQATDVLIAMPGSVDSLLGMLLNR